MQFDYECTAPIGTAIINMKTTAESPGEVDIYVNDVLTSSDGNASVNVSSPTAIVEIKVVDKNSLPFNLY